MSTVTRKIIVNLIIIALGYAIKEIGVLARDERRVLSKLVLYITLPATSLRVISGADLTWQLLVLPGVIFVCALLMCLTGFLPARALKLTRGEHGTFVVSLCGFMASLGYPFVEVAYGDAGMRALAVGDLGNALAIFGVAYYIAYRYSANGHFSTLDIAKKLATFVPLQAFILGLLLNVGNISLRGLPADLVMTLSAANSPLMLLMLGSYLDLDISLQESKVLVVNIIYKYAAGLAIAWLCIQILPFRGVLRTVTFLLPLMPTSLSTLIYSVEQGLSAKLAAMLISLSMLISLTIMSFTLIGSDYVGGTP